MNQTYQAKSTHNQNQSHIHGIPSHLTDSIGQHTRNSSRRSEASRTRAWNRHGRGVRVIPVAAAIVVMV